MKRRVQACRRQLADVVRFWSISFIALSISCNGGEPGHDAVGTEPEFSLWTACASQTEILFPATALGQTSHVGVVAVRTATGSAGNQTLVTSLFVDGPAASDFTVAPDVTSCADAALLEGGSCYVHLIFSPSAVGARVGTLHIGATSITVSGTATNMPVGLTANLSNAPFARGVYSMSDTYSLVVSNTSPSAITLDPPSLGGDTFSVTSQCPSTLTAGAACIVTLGLQEVKQGCVADVLHIGSSANALDVPVTQDFSPGVDVSLSGTGAGRMTSDPPGIDCVLVPEMAPAGHCANAFVGGPTQVTLIVTPEAGTHFNGWDTRSCVVDDAACTVPTTALDYDGPHASYASARLAGPDTKLLDITFLGNGRGDVVSPSTAACRSSCQRWVAPAEQLSLFARTPSVFGGFTGACATGTQMCDLGLIINDRAVSLTFSKEEGELDTLLPGVPITDGTFLPGGDFLVAGRGRVSRVSPTGTVVWTVILFGRLDSVIDVVPRAAGGAYLLAGGQLLAISDQGQLLWRRASSAIALAAGPAGPVVATLSDVQLLSDTDGTAVWTAPVPTNYDRTLAVSSTGMTAVALFDGTLYRFDASGTHLAPDWTLPVGASIRFDTADQLVSLSFSGTTSLSHTVARYDGTGAVTSSITSPSTFMPTEIAGRGIEPASNGRLFTWIGYQYRLHSDYPAGGLIESFDSSTRTWALSKVGIPDGYGNGDMVVIDDAACDGAGHCALFGTWNQEPGWIEVFNVL